MGRQGRETRLHGVRLAGPLPLVRRGSAEDGRAQADGQLPRFHHPARPRPHLAARAVHGGRAWRRELPSRGQQPGAVLHPQRRRFDGLHAGVAGGRHQGGVDRARDRAAGRVRVGVDALRRQTRGLRTASAGVALPRPAADGLGRDPVARRRPGHARRGRAAQRRPVVRRRDRGRSTHPQGTAGVPQRGTVAGRDRPRSRRPRRRRAGPAGSARQRHPRRARATQRRVRGDHLPQPSGPADVRPADPPGPHDHADGHADRTRRHPGGLDVRGRRHVHQRRPGDPRRRAEGRRPGGVDGVRSGRAAPKARAGRVDQRQVAVARGRTDRPRGRAGRRDLR